MTTDFPAKAKQTSQSIPKQDTTFTGYSVFFFFFTAAAGKHSLRRFGEVQGPVEVKGHLGGGLHNPLASALAA
jgi:hypothetical protein